MRATLLLVVLAACAVAPAPVPPAPRPPPASPAPDASDECVPEKGDPFGHHAQRVYCDHVEDHCCMDGSWICEDLHYASWFTRYCEE